jgi:hypothetical protein
MYVEIDGNKIKRVDGKGVESPQRIAIYLVKGNAWPVAEWRDAQNRLRTACVTSLTVKTPPAPAETDDAPPPPRLAPKPPKPPKKPKD